MTRLLPFLMMARASGLAGGFLKKAADTLRAASGGPPPPALQLDAAPSWDALQQELDKQTPAEEVEIAKQVAAGRGPPTASANLRLFDAPDGYEPRVTLYRDGSSWCPYCQKVWMQLEEKRIPYKVERINMRCYGEKPAWFQRETGGLLPVVRLDGDLITDSVSIMFALERAFADDTESLLPPGGLDEIRPLMNLESQHAGAWLGWLRAPPGGGGGARSNYERVLQQMDGALASTSGGFFLGTELSLVDLLFCSFLERAEASLLYYKGFRVRDATKYPNICAWFDAMESRPSFRASQSDYYTHAMDLPPQLGGCSAESGGEAQRALLDGGEWTLASLSQQPLQPLRDTDETAAKRRAARQLIGNHARVVPFACRAHAPPGVPPVMAPLADPNNASPVRWHEDDVDCALRHVAHALLTSPGAIPRQDGGDDPAPTARAFEYLRKRVGVPRDMDYEAARQFRAHLTHAIDELVA
jgi:glutathione S-transferase